MIDFATVLYNLLAAGAGLAATAGAGELGKKAVVTAFDAVKARLTGAHKVGGLDMLDKPAFAEGVKSELAKPEIAADADLLKLADTLRASILALPAAETARYAVEMQTIRAGRDVLLRSIDGAVKVGTIDAGQDAVIENIRGGPGKS